MSLPPGVSLQDIVAALAAQSPPPAAAPLTAAEVSSLSRLPFTPSTLISASNTNALSLHCIFCSTIILLPSVASYLHRRIPLPPFSSASPSPASEQQQAEGEQAEQEAAVEHVWRVGNQMDFENVGVTRAVQGEAGGDGSAAAAGSKYLCCGACDRGPIGVVFAAEPSMFYVAHGRVAYK